MAKIGFIGTGKMASAIIKGLVGKGIYKTNEIIACNPHKDSRMKAEKDLGIEVFSTTNEVVSKTDVIILAVKPQQIPSVLSEKNLGFTKKHLLISIAAGTKIEKIKSYVPDAKIVRVMPNICSTNFVGMTCFSVENGCSKKDMNTIESIFSSVGKCIEVKEKDMDAVSALSGSSPAFMFMIIDAMADAGVLLGLSRETSLLLASQSMYGSAVTFMESNEHPDKLKDMVCSPGGTTIEGVKVLEKHGLRSAIIAGIEASANKSKELGEK